MVAGRGRAEVDEHVVQSTNTKQRSCNRAAFTEESIDMWQLISKLISTEA